MCDSNIDPFDEGRRARGNCDDLTRETVAGTLPPDEDQSRSATQAVGALDLAPLEAGARFLGIALTQPQREQFDRYLGLLLRANASFNLTSVRDPLLIQQRHFVEAISVGVQLAAHGQLGAGARLLDLGSGAGLPGIPLALVWPAVEVTLLEATGKKARFIESAVAALALPHTSVLSGRAETLARDPRQRGQFDIVVARAVAALPALLELGLPFLRLGGTLAAVKGSRAEGELADAHTALRTLGAVLAGEEPVSADGLTRLLLFTKRRPTPSAYPRRPGLPVAHPLGSGEARPTRGAAAGAP